MDKAFSLLDVWAGCPNDRLPGHSRVHFASKDSDDGRWTLKGGDVECPIPEGEDFDSHWALIQEWTGRP